MCIYNHLLCVSIIKRNMRLRMVLHSPHEYVTKAYLATPMDEVELALVSSYLSDKHYRILPSLQFVCQFQATTHS